jgi:hypothetical protein
MTTALATPRCAPRTWTPAARDARARHPLRALHLRKTPETPATSTTTKPGAQPGEAFRSGRPVRGFEHVATLPMPRCCRDPVQVYRLAEEDPANEGRSRGAPAA